MLCGQAVREVFQPGRWAATARRRRIGPVKLPDLEAEALKLPVVERARLAETLLESLDELSEEEHRLLWTEEALRRDAELDADPSRARPADNVFRDARARRG
jgi:putative addiction module component (TIGR02574 family)